MPVNDPTRCSVDHSVNGSRSSQRLIWFLAVLATSMFEIAAADGEQPLWTMVIVLFEAAFCAAAFFWEQSLYRRRLTAESRIPLLFGLISGCYTVELLVRYATRTIPTLELLLLIYFRDTVLVLAAFAGHPQHRRACAVISTFLAIFSSSISHQPWIQCLVAIFAVVSTWWLMTAYWESLTLVRRSVSKQRVPRRWMVGIPGMLFLLMLLPVAGSQTRVLQGFLPSSGGTDWYSESARDGVGDGDAIVAGTEHIQSFGPIDDAPFMTSHEPSLYDMFDDTYDEPVRPPKQDRAVSVPQPQSSLAKERELAETQQAGKQFSTLRKLEESKSSRIENRASPAVLYVKGRVPLHLKLESFDLYDGTDWFPEPLPNSPAPLSIQTRSGRPWLRLPVQASSDLYGAPETHALKIIRIDTNRIPSPTQLMGIHIDQVDRLDMYAWAQPELIKLNREKLPPLTVFHLQSRISDRKRLSSAETLLQRGGTGRYHQSLNDRASVQIRQLAESLTEGIAAGWPQIDTIVRYVRSANIQDSQAKPPVDCENTVAHFLFDRQRGPDYLFASSTVMMLRSLGYSSRLVSGFYANPVRYDDRNCHTLVLPNDVHFWAEVQVGPGDWIPLEPTPGYELLQPPPTLIEKLQAAISAGCEFLWNQALVLSVTALLAAALWWVRIPIADGAATLAWRVNCSHAPRETVRWTAWLLAQRCRWIGKPCPRDLTQTRWLGTFTDRDDAVPKVTFSEFRDLVDWASYAPPIEPTPHSDVHKLCSAVIREWSRNRLVAASSNAVVTHHATLVTQRDETSSHEDAH